MRYLTTSAFLVALPFLAACNSAPIITYIDRGDIEGVESALPASKYRTDPTIAGTACQSDKPEVFKFLVDNGARLEASGVWNSTLFMCIYSNRVEMTRYLLAKGVNITPGDLKFAKKHAPRIHTILQAELSRRANPSAGPAPEVILVPRAAAHAVTPTALRAEFPQVRAVSDIDTPARRGAERPDDFALVIGIEDYQSLPKADYGVRDARTMRLHLEAMGFPPRNIISLEGPQATGNKLKSYLEEWLPLNVKQESTLFVFYSGHGAPDPKTGDAYLVPWDGDASFLKSTAYPLSKFYADLSKTKAKRVIVALDACFSGAGGRSVLAQGARPLVAKVAETPAGGRVTVLAAASGEEITGSLNEQGHGMFTYFLLKALSEGKRTAKELHDSLSPRVQDEARRQNRQQTPSLIGEDSPL